MDMGKPVIIISNYAGDYVRFHANNTRAAHCADCGQALRAGQGVRRTVRNAKGTGYLCHRCAGALILDWARRANTPNFYSYSTFTATLTPFDGVYAIHPIPAAELAQAWADHGASGLRFAAETLREQARAEFLKIRNIPYISEKTYSLAVTA